MVSYGKGRRFGDGFLKKKGKGRVETDGERWVLIIFKRGAGPKTKLKKKPGGGGSGGSEHASVFKYFQSVLGFFYGVFFFVMR